MRGRSFKTNPYTPRAVVVIMLLLSTSVLIVVPDATTSWEEFPEPPPMPFADPPIFENFTIRPEVGWNDTTFDFWLNFSSEEDPVNVSVKVYIDWIAYDMWENDTRDDNYSDGKDYYWMNENRLWSKGFIPYFYYVEINNTENTSETNYFEILNRDPYMLEGPFGHIEIDEEFEWEGRATDEDLDPLNWTLFHNMSEDDYTEFEFVQNNTTSKIKIKCNQTFTRWFNLTVYDYLDNEAYWNWTVYCNQTGGTDFYWTGGGDGISWDDYLNWLLDDWSVPVAGEYPKDNADRAFLNESADDLYLQDGANSVITIGELKLSSGFTGSVTQSIDLVVDSAGTHSGHIEVSAGTWDVNTSNEQINMDGNLYISSSATFTERSGTLIVQGAATQEIRVQSTNRLYKLTTDTSGTIAELYDNATMYQLTIGTGTTYKMDANTRGYELWTNFTDVVSCGFVSTSAGTLNLIGVFGGRQANITTADSSPPPTNYWLGTPYSAAQFTLNLANTTLSYGYRMSSRGSGNAILSNVTITNFISTWALAIRDDSTSTPSDLTISGTSTYGLSLAGSPLKPITNIDLSGGSFTNDVNIDWTVTTSEFVSSNFDETSVRTTGSSHANSWVSQTHNDVANAYKLGCQSGYTFSKSTITHDFTTGDNIELVSGKFIMDEDGAMKQLKINTGTTWQVGKDTPDAAITLTFDDSASAGFHGSGDGTFITTGTSVYGMTLRSVNNPPTTQWNLGTAGELVTMDWTTVQDHNKAGGNDFWDVENTTFTHSGTDYVVHLQYLTKFANVTISTTTGHGMYMADEFLEYYNVVITSGAGKYDLRVEARLEFQYSNFDTSKVVFGGLMPAGGTGNYTSMNHNDIVTAYKIGTGTLRAPHHLKKSFITHDFDSTFDVEIVQGSLGLDENADARGMFVSSGAYLSQNTGTTFDVSGNLTVNGTFLSDGTITDSGDYFDFWIGGGSVWLNNSTVSSAKLAYYHGGFNFTVGNSANSTINEWTLEAPSGIDTDFNITYYDFNNKGSGVIWHLNATVASGSVYFGTDNLTANERYDSYVDTVLYREHTADAGGWVNFSYNGWSTRHIYLTWVVGGPAPPPPPPPPPGGRWIHIVVAYFEHTTNGRIANFQGEDRGKYGTTTPDDFTYSWDFGDGSESDGINATHSYSFFLFKSYNVKLTVCEIGEDDCDCYEDQVMLIDWPMVALMGGLMVVLFTAFILPRVIKKRYWIAVE